ncbi:hypothetical protein DFH06DRAFT_1145560 [Mycena polygramma]|nr:hypothetical protein DFH06DRAFT_1145560 [Mycena polygramma]
MTPRVAEHSEDLGAAESADSAGLIGIGGGNAGDACPTISGRLCRLAARAPLEAAEAYLNIRPYKERPGHVYTHLRPNWEILGANATDDDELSRWGKPTIWSCAWRIMRSIAWMNLSSGRILTRPPAQSSSRLTHLTLWAMDAKRVSYPCYGCNVRHREHFSEAKSGGLEVVAAIIEYWLGRIGEYRGPRSTCEPESQTKVGISGSGQPCYGVGSLVNQFGRYARSVSRSSRLGSPSGKVVQTNGLESSVAIFSTSLNRRRRSWPTEASKAWATSRIDAQSDPPPTQSQADMMTHKSATIGPCNCESLRPREDSGVTRGCGCAGPPGKLFPHNNQRDCRASVRLVALRAKGTRHVEKLQDT